MQDTLLWLAKEMDDHTHGNETIFLDWGNYSIKCNSCELKNLLVELAKDYVRLRGVIDNENCKKN